jgi:hypothetical protein
MLKYGIHYEIYCGNGSYRFPWRPLEAHGRNVDIFNVLPSGTYYYQCALKTDTPNAG